MIYIGEKRKRRRRATRIGVLVERKKEDSRKGDVFFKKNFQHALGKGEGKRSILLGDLGIVLRKKHRGRDWQQASSSRLKPSNISQRLVLPGMVM